MDGALHTLACSLSDIYQGLGKEARGDNMAVAKSVERAANEGIVRLMAFCRGLDAVRRRAPYTARPRDAHGRHVRLGLARNYAAGMRVYGAGQLSSAR